MVVKQNAGGDGEEQEMPTPPPTVPLSGSEAGEEKGVSSESESSSESDSSASNGSTNDDVGEERDAAGADLSGRPEANDGVGQEEEQAEPAAELQNPRDNEEMDEES